MSRTNRSLPFWHESRASALPEACVLFPERPLSEKGIYPGVGCGRMRMSHHIEAVRRAWIDSKLRLIPGGEPTHGDEQ
jgi:hypothetical protein